jgi:hypothetical protein
MYTETHIAVFLTLAVLDFSYDFVLVALIGSFPLDLFQTKIHSLL